ncbi:hypothetical protein GLP30_18935 [Photobacterium phosphoreum]|uniref:Conjugal transfer protein TraM n=1 Tax=Photobacterium phosphoreum TaxID=659 RepID=A0AAW5A2R9_PHOPO|nr:MULTISPECIES: hypothetical protein [Photobacterium]MCD9465107.1 hypothetical protein [Photobacterium phosphoreum]MCD9472616.1 hypothetical protein [Photobacterium phosphoreum]MCD9477116.1 hypothetical protein [Photobacterium phosphoreum]MCD9481052.1 hypothetical protein [Photobacterium phosphoreum]MCD9485378.1 hypothetical protein [Photobacterium phosphoreum]
MSDKNIPVDLKEAYLQEMQCEVILFREELKEIHTESVVRIGITQEIIETQLNNANEALNKYTQAANVHFSTTKKELKDIAENELKETITKSFLEANKQLLVLHKPKRNISDIVISAFVFSAIGLTIGLLLANNISFK